MQRLTMRAETAGFWLLMATLAWAPFPLGSARQWSTGLLILLLAACWTLWAVSVWSDLAQPARYLKRLWIPIVLGALALMWGIVQSLPIVPPDWVHPIWPLAADALGRKLEGAISLAPWRTLFEVLKLASYAGAAWLACNFASTSARAERMLDVIVAIGAFYAAYALVLWTTGIRQFELFYSTVPVGKFMAGPFVLHNSYATFAGLCSLAAIARFYDVGAKRVIVGRGLRPWLLSLTQYLFGRGAFYAVAFVLTFSSVIFSASRAGFAATVIGLFVLLLLSLKLSARRSTMWAAAGAALVAVVVVTILFEASGDTMQTRLNMFVQAGGPDNVRLLAWQSAQRMIADSPWLGLGLGSFEYAYPLYGSQVIPFVLDKAHNDWLELAAGWGLPAAIAWWLALAYSTGLCVRALFIRRRDRIYPLLAVGATALVAAHSAFDFSLQIPAVALLYAIILGLGVGQAFSTRA